MRRALAVLLATAAACQSSDAFRVDQCFILVAQIVPGGPVLHIGDTVSVHAAFFPNAAAECLPADTTPAGLRWISSDTGAVAIDSVAGRLTARRPGWSSIYVVPAGGGGRGVLGVSSASVLEPAGADSLISIVANLASDSATVVLNDAAGITLRSVTLRAGGSRCWNTPLSDSVQYSAQVYLPGQSGATSLGAKWVVHAAFASTHTWRVSIDPQSSGLPALDLAGVQPDRGC